MSSNPVVSVIVAVYNSENYLSKCLDSIINQTLKDIEIICVNDGSSDDSLNILKSYRQKDDRVFVIDQFHQNAGVARNAGLMAAKGKYLSFLDADDFFEENMLEDAVNAAEKDEDIDVVVYGANSYDTKTGKSSYMNYSLRKKNLPKNNPFAPSEMSEHLFNSFQNWAWNKLFRRSFIIENKIFFQDVARTNDMFFTCMALAKAHKICAVDEALTNYRVGGFENLQSTNHLVPDAFMSAYEKTYRALKETLKDEYAQFDKSLMNLILNGMRYNYNRISVDKKAASFVASLIAYKGEEVFHLSSYDRASFRYPDNYDWYLELLKTSGKKQGRFSSLVSDIRRCYKENGLSYTIKRVLFHLHLYKDNDPARTERVNHAKKHEEL